MADVGSVKTLHNFSPLKPFAASTIQAVTIAKRRQILLLSNGSDFLYLVEDDTLIVSNKEILDFTQCTTSKRSFTLRKGKQRRLITLLVSTQAALY